jgi:hypothetical protein
MTPAPEKTYIVALTENEIDRFLAALDEAPQMIVHARSICDALYAMVTQDQVILDEMTGFLDMSARGFEAAERQHGAAILALAGRLRDLHAAISGLRALDARRAAPRSDSTEGGNDDD